MSDRRRWFLVLCTATSVGCSTRGSGGGGDDDDDSGSTAWIAPWSACSGESVDEIWEGVFELRIWAVPAFEPLMRCMASAPDCPGVLACVGYDTDASCDRDEMPDSCEGQSEIVACDSLPNDLNLVWRFDCSDDPDGNTRCAVDDDGYSQCSSGTCDASSEGRWCEGNERTWCYAGVETRDDCSATDRTCITAEDIAECGVEGESCTEDSCDGSELVRCDEDVGVVIQRVDCGSLFEGTGCIEEAEGARCGLGPADAECEERDIRCEGSVARTCFGGKWFDVDCGTFSGSSCGPSPDEHGVSCIAPDWP